jgi:hypothetical protein
MYKDYDLRNLRAERLLRAAKAHQLICIDPQMDSTIGEVGLSGRKRTEEDVLLDMYFIISTIESGLTTISAGVKSRAKTKLNQEKGEGGYSDKDLEEACETMAERDGGTYVNFLSTKGRRIFLSKCFKALYSLEAFDSIVSEEEFVNELEPLSRWFFEYSEKELQCLEYIADESCMRPNSHARKTINEEHYNIPAYSPSWFKMISRIDRQLQNMAVSEVCLTKSEAS